MTYSPFLHHRRVLVLALVHGVDDDLLVFVFERLEEEAVHHALQDALLCFLAFGDFDRHPLAFLVVIAVGFGRDACPELLGVGPLERCELVEVWSLVVGLIFAVAHVVVDVVDVFALELVQRRQVRLRFFAVVRVLFDEVEELFFGLFERHASLAADPPGHVHQLCEQPLPRLSACRARSLRPEAR